jgi:hypothetical protein
MQLQQNPVISSAEKELDARWGRLSHPTGRGFSRWILEVRQWWGESKQRLVAGELCRIPLRISAIWHDSYLRYGPALPSDPCRTGRANLAQENIFLSSCSDGIKELSRKHEWMGPLDQQLAGEAFRLGASWAFRTPDSCRKADDTAQNHSSGKFSSAFGYDPNDRESKQKLDELLSKFGVSPPEFLSHNFSQLVENLLWREITSAREGDEDTTLHVFLDLGEGDEIQLATVRAGEISAFSHTELYADSKEHPRQLIFRCS